MNSISLTLLLFLSACAPAPKDIQTVTYYFGDASVAEQYQRNYTITFTEKTMKIVVDTYGREIASSEEKLSPEKFAELQEKTAAIFSHYKGKTLQCDGGHERTVTTEDKAGKKKTLTWNCATPPEKVLNYFDYLEDLAPNLGKLLATPVPGYEDKK